ncbi:MAG: ATP-binding cassette domain-containing protein, partial [Oscillospiraceae bacterium]|nr:ATP-binding cassette domain-containing protein [Oscillospiraceae bacterium]
EGRRVAVLFQENRLLPHLSALDNLKLVLPRGRQQEALCWLERLGLSDSAHKTPLQLSGGMNRRLAIARTLAYGGDVYLLDEPFQGLDEATLQHCLSIVRDATKGKLLLLVTHRREEADALCDTVLELSGRPLTVEASTKRRD